MLVNKYSEERPWGCFERFCHNKVCTVKIITIKPNSALSLQYHKKRDEWWHLLDGAAQFVIGDDVERGKRGDEFFVPRTIPHRIKTERKSGARVLEISFGKFDENDIVRLEDKYKRD